MKNDLGRYRKLYTRLWRHPGFAELSDAEKVLAIYLVTGPQSNRLGLYLFSIATAAEDLGTVPETLSKRLVGVCQTFGWVFDKRFRVLFIPSWFKWNPPENENVMKGSLKDLNEIPPCGLVDAFARNIGTLPQTLQGTFVEGLRQRLPNGMRTQDQDQEQDQKQGTGTGDRAPRGGASRRASLVLSERTTKDADDEKHNLLPLARQVLKVTNPRAAIEELFDAFKNMHQGNTSPKAHIIEALNAAVLEHRAIPS